MLRMGIPVRDYHQNFNRKIFLIPMAFVTIFLTIIGISVRDYIEDHSYNHLEKETMQLARGYSNSLSLASEASRVVDGFLGEKIIGAARLVGDHEGEMTPEFLRSIAEAFGVEKIYVYDGEGVITATYTGEYLGWRAEEGHPVHAFLQGEADVLVEEIRPDTATGVNYKYGYYRMPEGGFVQVGIPAQEIKGFLLSFQIRSLIERIMLDETIRGSSFINNEHIIIESSLPDRKGRPIEDPKVLEALESDEEQGFINEMEGRRVQVTLVPVMLNGSRYGTLAVTRWTEDTDRFINQVTILGFVSLAVLWGLFLYAIRSADKKNKRLLALAYFDDLTGLPNKISLMETLSRELRENPPLRGGLILLNLLNFKEINIRYGYEEGDRILKAMGEKLKGLLADEGRCFRFTGDRFIYWSEARQDQASLEDLAMKINQVFSGSTPSGSFSEPLFLRMGILELGPAYQRVDTILRDVSLSLDSVSGDGARNYSFFNEEMERRSSREKVIEKTLRKAVDQPEEEFLSLVYQPQYDYRLQRVTSLEALARLTVPGLGAVSPVEFIEIAEKRQLIVPLGDRLMEMACRFIKRMERKGYPGVKVAVNISPIQLLQEDFVQKIIAVLERHQVPASSLVLEITESVLIHRYETINEDFKTLEAMGVEISLDDFGTGYSSLARLREMNIHQIKIDKSFIFNLRDDFPGEFVTGEIIAIAHKFGLEVVAEGVETRMQWDYLKTHHCDIAQGYHLSKPLDEEKLMGFMASGGKPD